MLAKQLDDALCSSGSGDWRARGKCASCQAPTTGTTAIRANGTEESQPMSLLAELEQAEAANSKAVAQPETLRMVDVDLTRRPEDRTLSDLEMSEVDAAERLATRLCEMIERQRNSDDGLRSLEFSADIRYRLMKLIAGGGNDDSTPTGGKPTESVDLAEQVRNRDGRVAELTCEVCKICG